MSQLICPGSLDECPTGADRTRVESKLIWHLSKIKKGLLKKSIVPMEDVGIPLLEIKVS
jgi:hypothetical protein